MILKTKILPKNKLKIEDPPIRNYEVTEIWVTRMALVVSEGMVAGCNFAVYYSWGAYFMKT